MKSKMGAGISGVLSSGDFGTAGKKIGSSLVDGISSSFGPLGSAAGEVATALGPTGIVATAAVAGAVIIGSAASQAAMEWEAGMSQISKTTGIAKGTEDFAALNSGLKDLYSTMPTTVSGIQGVASAAGSLGIEKSSIAGFTEVALQMGSAFDMSAEEAAVSIGKIKSQLKSLPEGVSDSTEFAKQMGSAIDYVGNNFNATEKDVLEFSTRTAGSLSALGGNAYEIAGWGGMLASVFPSAERAAGSFDSLLTQLTTNTDSQTAAADLLGVSTEEFMQAMSTDPSDTLLNIGSALEGLPADKLLSMTKDLGGAYGMDALTKMVGHTEEWRKAIDDTVAAGQKGESIGQSFTAGADNAKSAFQVLKNSIGAILTDIGGPINAALTPVITAAASGLNKIRTIGENLWEPFTAAISPATEAVSLLAEGIGSLAGMSLDVLVTGSKAVNTAFTVGKAFVSAFGEEITNVITSSSAFQTVAGYVTSITSAFTSLSTGVSEVVSDVVSGFTNAIPTAISGTADAVGTLLDKAGLGGIADAASSVGGFLGDVYDNAAKKLGWNTEEAVSSGTEKGMEKGAEAAKNSVSDSTAEAVQKAFDDYWSNVEQLQSQGIQTGYALSAKAGTVVKNNDNNWKKNTWTTQATISELPVEVHHDVTSQGSKYTLRINGVDVASRTTDNYDLTPREDLVRSMLAEAGLSTDTATTLDLANKKLDAAVVRQNLSITTDTYLDYADNLKDEMSAAGETIGDALTAGMVPDSDTLQASINSLKTLKLYDPEEFSSQGGENALSYLESLDAAITKYDAAKVALQLDPDNEDLIKSVDSLHDMVQTRLDNSPIELKVEVKPEWGEFDTKSLSELIYDPEELKKSVVDVDRFWEGTMLPDIKSKAESAKEAWESGQVTQDDIYKSLIEPLEALDEYTPDSIEALNELFQTGQIDISEYVDALNSLSSAADSMSDSVSESVSEASEMIAGLYYGTSGTSTSWMDYVNSEGGYTGPTKYYGGYADWKADEASTAQEINEKYGITTVGSISMEIEADASPAKSESDTLISEIETSDPTMTVLMDTTVADARFQNLYNLIVNSNPVVTVQLDFAMDDIRAIIESEVRKALK